MVSELTLEEGEDRPAGSQGTAFQAEDTIHAKATGAGLTAWCVGNCLEQVSQGREEGGGTGGQEQVKQRPCGALGGRVLTPRRWDPGGPRVEEGGA